MNDHPIHAGSMLFTMVDPERGHEVEYNRWYERDHFYAGCMIGPWLFAGKRWVATRELKDLRFPRGDTPVASPVEKGSYLAVYYVLEGKHGEPGAALMLFRTYPRVPFWEQIHEAKPFFTDSGRFLLLSSNGND